MPPSPISAAKALIWEGLAGFRFPLAEDGVWRVSAPVDELVGAEAVERGFYRPLTRALGEMVFCPYLFLGGAWGEETWVAASGDLTGNFTRPLFGISPTGGPVRLRIGAFFRVAGERVAEAYLIADLPGLAAQAGFEVLPPFAGETGPPPGPAADNGIRRGRSFAAETEKTLTLVESMLGGCNRLEDDDLASMGMAAFWHADMLWHGPWGIGSCRGFESFQRDAQGPSVASFPNRRGGFHRCRFADGCAAAFVGWPSLRGTFNGKPFRGIPPTGKPIGQRIMDFYIRRDDLLAENWVLIDLVDFARQCNTVLEPIAAAGTPPQNGET